MLLEVVSVVKAVAPGLLTHSTVSVAYIRTSHPKFLIFEADSEKPTCVVEFGPESELRRVHDTLVQLHHRLPNAIPRSLVCAAWRKGVHVHIQEGLPGVPWFRVADHCQSRHDWNELIRRAVETMARFHSALADVPRWTRQVNVHRELRQQLRQLDIEGVSLSSAASCCADSWAREFESGPPLDGVCQHGDFSINNILVSDDGLRIIDFEEFGATAMPLHDAFGLALSFSLSQSRRCPLSRAQCIAACVEPSLTSGLERHHLPALLLHFLLWRINQSGRLAQRTEVRKVLLRWVDELTRSPNDFLYAQ